MTGDFDITQSMMKDDITGILAANCEIIQFWIFKNAVAICSWL